MSEEFNPSEFAKFKAKSKLDESSGFDPKEFESFKGAHSAADDVHFYELEKQPGVPRAEGNDALNLRNYGPLAKQVGRQLVEGSMSPMPGSIVSLPARAMQENAAQAGADVARGFSTPGGVLPDIGKVPARVAGFIASLMLDPTNLISLKANVGAAKVPTERLPGVNAAQEMGIPLSRAEMTGGRASGGIESALEKTMTGSDVINDFRKTGSDAMEQAKTALKTQHGTTATPRAVGTQVREGINATVQRLKDQAQSIYEGLPNEAVKPVELRSASDQLLLEQHSLPRVDRDSALLARIKEYRKLGLKIQRTVRSGIDETGSPFQEVKYKKVENPAGYLKVKALQRLSSDLGDAWRKSFKAGETIGSVNGRDAAILRSAIQQDLQNVGSLSMALKAANKLYRQAKTIDKNPLVKRLRTAGPEEAMELIFDGKRSSKVLMAKAAAGDSFNAAKASYFNKLVGSPTLARDLDKMAPEYLQTVFSSEELGKLRKLAAVQRLRGAAEKMSGTVGSSRTNASLAQGAGVLGGLSTMITGAATLNPGVALGGATTAAGAYFGPKLAAKAYLKYGVSGLQPAIHPIGTGQVAPRTGAYSRPLDVLKSYLARERGQQ